MLPYVSTQFCSSGNDDSGELKALALERTGFWLHITGLMDLTNVCYSQGRAQHFLFSEHSISKNPSVLIFAMEGGESLTASVAT